MSQRRTGNLERNIAGGSWQPDVVARRRIDRLRRDLGLSTVPTPAGTALRQQARLIEESLATMLPTFAPRYNLLPTEGKQLWRSAVSNALDEFISLVENRPPRGAPVDGILVAIGRAEGHAGCDLMQLLTIVEAARTVLSDFSTQLPLTPTQARELDDALARYVGYLYRCAEKGHETTHARASIHAEPMSPDEIRIRTLFALLEHGWVMHPTPVYLSVSCRLGGGSQTEYQASDCVQQRYPHRSPLRILTGDHVATLDQEPCSESGGPDDHVVVAGPVSHEELSRVYDTSVLLLRLICLGMAAPSSPVRCPKPDLGLPLLDPCPDSAQRIAKLLSPLMELPPSTRVTLAHTLRLWLGTRVTIQDLAILLQLHQQTVRNHLSRLRDIYPNSGYSYEQAPVLLTALDLVLPLWEQEARGGKQTEAVTFL